jgi:acetyl-CoA carboxylase biotin carboxyl carrier protein
MSEKKTGAGLDPSLVRELAAVLKDMDLTEIVYEQGDVKLRLAKATAAPIYAAAPAAQAILPPPPLALAPPSAGSAAEPAAAPTDERGAVRSPMVGTAYLSPEPGAAAFVKVGDTVTEGQTLLIVEAMKTFNPIPAPHAGKVKAIRVSDAQPVEYGEILLVVE